MPTNMLFIVRGYGHGGEISRSAQGNLPFWNYDPSWQQRLFGVCSAGTEDKFVSEAEHRPT